MDCEVMLFQYFTINKPLNVLTSPTRQDKIQTEAATTKEERKCERENENSASNEIERKGERKLFFMWQSHISLLH